MKYCRDTFVTLFGKSTHIYMISNSVTHLRSYTNFAIADIEKKIRVDITVNSARSPSADVSASSAGIVASNHECSSVS